MKNPNEKRSAFTLIELLVAITIVGLLAAAALSGLSLIREKSKVTRTERTVQKLHLLLMEKLEGYGNRRIEIDSEDAIPDVIERTGKMYDLMRMEMPDRDTDLYLQVDLFNPTPLPPGAVALDTRSATAERYYRKYTNRDTGNENADKNSPSAEFLYMIIMDIPGAAEQFSETEIGDVDGDGLREFVDAWGNPIKFLRWPVGFRPDTQAITDLQDFDASTDPANPTMYNDTTKKAPADPFDPRGVIKYLFTTPPSASFPVYPLVYSAGPDKHYDINLGWTTPPTRYNYIAVPGTGGIYMVNPFALDGQATPYQVGEPLNEDTYDITELRHTDNITNHMMDYGKVYE